METTFFTSYHTTKANKRGHETFDDSFYSLNHCTVVITFKNKKTSTFSKLPEKLILRQFMSYSRFRFKMDEKTFSSPTNQVYATNHMSSSISAACDKQSKAFSSEKSFGVKQKIENVEQSKQKFCNEALIKIFSSLASG